MLLLRTHIIEVLCSAEAALSAHADHAHAHEACHCAGGVACGGLHCVRSCVRHSACHHKRVGTDACSILHLVYLLHVFVGQSDRIEGDLADGNTPVLYPFLPQGIVHGCFQLIGLCGYLRRTELLFGKCAESRLKCVNELDLQLTVDLIPCELIIYVSAKPCIELYGIRDDIGIYAVAADLNGSAHIDALVDDLENDGVRCAELVVQNFLGVEIVNALILGSLTAVGETLAKLFEGGLDAVAELSGEDAGLKVGTVGEFAGFCAEFNYLAVFNDYHCLTVRNGDAGTVRNDIVTCLGVGGSAAYALLTLSHQHIVGKRFTIEKFLPLIG